MANDRKGRAGFMAYFDDWSALVEQDDDAMLGRFFRAAFQYAQDGHTSITFDGAYGLLWMMLKSRLDAGLAQYRQRVIENRYKGYKSAEGKRIRERAAAKGELKGMTETEVRALVDSELLSFDEWLERHKDNMDAFGRPLYE